MKFAKIALIASLLASSAAFAAPAPIGKVGARLLKPSSEMLTFNQAPKDVGYFVASYQHPEGNGNVTGG